MLLVNIATHRSNAVVETFAQIGEILYTKYSRGPMAVEDNTEGRQMNAYIRAYFAGLIDADGSIMLQLKPRSRSKFGVRAKTVLVIYQDSKMKKEMEWLHKELKAGYLYERNDHITEIRIEGHRKVREILTKLLPHLRFKKPQAELIISAIKYMQRKGIKTLDDLRIIAEISDKISACNYSSPRRKYTSKYVMQHVSP